MRGNAAGLPQIMRGHHKFGAVGLGCCQDGFDLAGGASIEAWCGLVEEQNFRPGHKAAGKCKFLLCAA